MSIDLGSLYRASRRRITTLVDDAKAETWVPATPLWRVHDVIAHLAGITEDVMTENMAGVTTDAWTAAQVERGRTQTLDELLSLWDRYAPTVEEFLSSPHGASAYLAVLDIHTHEADVLNALGLPVDLPDDFLHWMQPVLERDFHEAVGSAGCDPVEVTASNLQWFRGRLGRRTEHEVRSYGWSHDPGPYLDIWFIFGRAEQSLWETSTTHTA